MKRIGMGWLLAGVAVVLALVVALPRTPAGEPPAAPAGRVRVEVLNAAGIPRLAQRGTDRLRDEGFDVVYFGNAQGFSPDSSVVLLRAGDRTAAEAVARALGVTRIEEEPDSSLYLEVSVVLGRDWAP